MKLLSSTLLAASLAGATGYSAHGQGTFVYDQQSRSSPPPADDRTEFQASSRIGQSFTPSLSSVGFVQFWLYDRNVGNNLGATIQVNIREDGITGPILGSTTPLVLLDGYGITVYSETTFKFSNPVTLHPETKYYFEIMLQGDRAVSSFGSFGYTRGNGILSGTETPGASLWFREGVVVPEPSTMMLCLGGLGLLWGGRRFTRTTKL